MNTNILKIVISICVVCIIITAGVTVQTYNLLLTGGHLQKADIQYVINADSPWDSFPPFIKEYISKKASLETKLNLRDLTQVRDWYNDQIKNFKEPISLKETSKEKTGG